MAANEQQVLVNYMNARPDKLGTSYKVGGKLTIFEGFISKATKAMHSYIQHEMEPFGHTNINEQLLVHGTHIARDYWFYWLFLDS